MNYWNIGQVTLWGKVYGLIPECYGRLEDTISLYL